MFVGESLHSHAVGYIPRGRIKGERWTHWKVIVTRERYNDCAIISVDIDFLEARRSKGRWISRRRRLFRYSIGLGNLNDHEFRRRLHVNDDQNPSIHNPRVIAELEAVVELIVQYGATCLKNKDPFEGWRLRNLVERVCLEQLRERAAV